VLLGEVQRIGVRPLEVSQELRQLGENVPAEVAVKRDHIIAGRDHHVAALLQVHFPAARQHVQKGRHYLKQSKYYNNEFKKFLFGFGLAMFLDSDGIFAGPSTIYIGILPEQRGWSVAD